ncbi:hypothetical protein TanjilG_09881 [Lupinus angustifolius]|uniref:RST domain-containing protein n=1 Tax=Lupinus angustifolius TaxID=3871 RepID=A0A1J7GD13_LUPAN|nr:hypothetical protein TanjilG_09881 [Lupinus angustifolius]
MFVRLMEHDMVHDLIKKSFLRGLEGDFVKAKTEVVAILRSVCSSVMLQARVRSFQIYAQAVTKLRDGDVNMKYVWYGTRGEDEIEDIVSHSFGLAHAYGHQVCLSPDHSPLQSVKNSVADKNGLPKYIIWSSQMNTHVLPAYVISSRVSSFTGVEKSEEPLRPSSPWMPFPTLISVLSKEKKISRHELINKVRQIAGDKLLIAAIKSHRGKV